jgi:[ribosomal protein S5]-alanine N-acetyltransferase
MDFPVLETKRLQLKQITEQHIDRYFEIMAKDEVTKYYGMPSLTDREQARNLIQSFSERFAEKKSIRWGIIWCDTNEFLGTVGLNNWSPYSRKAEVGYELHPDFWGKGITTEAVSEIISYAFTKLNLFRIGAVTFPENHSSSKVLEKLGFQKEGVLRGYLYQKEQNHDALMFSLLKSEFLEGE